MVVIVTESVGLFVFDSLLHSGFSDLILFVISFQKLSQKKCCVQIGVDDIVLCTGWGQ